MSRSTSPLPPLCPAWPERPEWPEWRSAALADAAAAPWRNGGGLTRELAAWPTAADWRWRISVADVTADGPFSSFGGVRRWFAVLEGGGVELDAGGVRHRVLAGGEPLAFDGAARTHCRLLAGATRDLNLMVRQAPGQACAARMLRVAGHAVPVVWRANDTATATAIDAHEEKNNDPVTLAVYASGAAAVIAADGHTVTVPPHTLAWCDVPAGVALMLTATDAWLMEIPA